MNYEANPTITNIENTVFLPYSYTCKTLITLPPGYTDILNPCLTAQVTNSSGNLIFSANDTMICMIKVMNGLNETFALRVGNGNTAVGDNVVYWANTCGGLPIGTYTPIASCVKIFDSVGTFNVTGGFASGPPVMPNSVFGSAFGNNNRRHGVLTEVLWIIISLVIVVIIIAIIYCYYKSHQKKKKEADDQAKAKKNMQEDHK